jgi:hypothetical protein
MMHRNRPDRDLRSHLLAHRHQLWVLCQPDIALWRVESTQLRPQFLGRHSRQIGGSLGIAILVLLTSQTTGLGTAVAHFHHVWAFGAITSLGAGLIATLIPRPSAKATATVKALQPELVDADAELPLASPEPDA